jgi:hypothetical protein
MLTHSEEIRTKENQPVAYPVDDNGIEAVCDFGILSITQTIGAQPGITVSALGKPVMSWAAGGRFTLKDGPWVATLAAIRAQLDQQFGPVDLNGRCDAIRHR